MQQNLPCIEMALVLSDYLHMHYVSISTDRHASVCVSICMFVSMCVLTGVNFLSVLGGSAG